MEHAMLFIKVLPKRKRQLFFFLDINVERKEIFFIII